MKLPQVLLIGLVVIAALVVYFKFVHNMVVKQPAQSFDYQGYEAVD